MTSRDCGLIRLASWPFSAVAVCLSGSEFLRIRRRWTGTAAASRTPQGGAKEAAAIAAAETVAVLATGLVIYLSVNAVTHPVTLGMQATHLASWPTEGTLRMIALLLCVCSVSTHRFLRAYPGAGRGKSSGVTAAPADGVAIERRHRV